MKKNPLTRREFVRQTAAGTAGIAVSAVGIQAFSHTLFGDGDKPAILGGTPVRPAGSPPGGTWPVYDDTDVQLYLESFKSNKWSEFTFYEKDYTMRFARMYADQMGTKHCALTNSGTNALEAAQRAVDIGPGDEVITQTNTFIATAQSTLNLFALPVFVDSDPETFMIDANRIEERITERTRAILPVHIGGAAADMDKILEIARKHNLVVIEDACQAHMGEWKGKKLGSVGDMGCFSFQAFKSLCGGEGGAVICNDDLLISRLAGYTNNGRDPFGLDRCFTGSNFRMTPFVASILMGQIRRLEDQCRLRDANAQYLEKLLSEIKGVRPTKKYSGQTRRAYYEYQLIYDKGFFAGLPKNRFRKAMEAEGIEMGQGIDSSLHNSPDVEVYLNSKTFQKLYSKERLDRYRKENHCPVNETIENETGLSLPQIVFTGTKKDIEDIVKAIVKIQKSAELIGK